MFTGGGGARQHRRVDRHHADLAAADPPEAGDDRVAGRGRLAPQLGQRQQADLTPRAIVHERVDPLARGETTRRMVARDPLLATHAQRLGAPALEILQRSRARRLVDHGRALALPTAHQGGQHTPKSTNRLVILGDRRLVGERCSRC
jgi:hypothetical protein